MSNIGGGEKINKKIIYCHVKHRTGEKETREMKGEWVNQGHFFKKKMNDTSMTVSLITLRYILVNINELRLLHYRE